MPHTLVLRIHAFPLFSLLFLNLAVSQAHY